MGPLDCIENIEWIDPNTSILWHFEKVGVDHLLYTYELPI